MTPLELIDNRIRELEDQLDWMDRVNSRFTSKQRRRMAEERLEENKRWRSLLMGELLIGERYQ